MKKVLLSLCGLLLTIAAAAQVVYNPGALHEIAQQEAQRHQFRLTPPLSNAGINYNVGFYHLQLELNPTQNFIKGSNTIYFETTNSNVNLIRFDLSSDLTVDSVIYHGLAVNNTHQNDIIEVTLSQTLANGVIDSLEIFYQGIPNGSSGMGAFTVGMVNGSSALWTLSEPYGSSEWWPCKNNLTDKADSIQVTVLCPQGNKAATNGILVSEKSIGNNMQYVWKHNHPITTYLVAVAVSNYVEYSDWIKYNNGTDSIEVLNYVVPNSLSQAQQATGNSCQAAFDCFHGHFITYPYANEKYGHAQFGWGGGMEHQTMSFMGGWGFELIAHELAHQWFGDYITCGSWSDIWLNEGFATYLTGLNYEYHNYPNYWSAWKNNQVDFITSQPDGSVYCDDTLNVSRIFSSRLSYTKGAMILHQLRMVLGDADFFQGVNNYLNDPQLANGYARTYQLQDHWETVSGKNLDEYFTDWFYGQGHPIWDVFVVPMAGTQLQLTMGQTQSHSSVNFFEIPMEISFSNATQDTVIRFDVQSNNQQFIVDPGFAVTDYEINPLDNFITTAGHIEVGIPETDKVVMAIYPNPATTLLHIESPHADFKEIEIYDMQGRLAYQLQIDSSMQYELNVEGLPAGLYSIKIISSKGISNQKFLKQ